MHEWRNSVVSAMEFRYFALSHPICFGDSLVTSLGEPITQCTAARVVVMTTAGVGGDLEVVADFRDIVTILMV